MEVNGPRHMPVPYLLGANTKNLLDSRVMDSLVNTGRMWMASAIGIWLGKLHACELREKANLLWQNGIMNFLQFLSRCKVTSWYVMPNLTLPISNYPWYNLETMLCKCGVVKIHTRLTPLPVFSFSILFSFSFSKVSLIIFWEKESMCVDAHTYSLSFTHTWWFNSDCFTQCLFLVHLLILYQ